LEYGTHCLLNMDPAGATLGRWVWSASVQDCFSELWDQTKAGLLGLY
jgi:hypothetical protein